MIPVPRTLLAMSGTEAAENSPVPQTAENSPVRTVTPSEKATSAENPPVRNVTPAPIAANTAAPDVPAAARANMGMAITGARNRIS